MSINFTARHTSVTPEIRQFCEKRIKSLEKFLGKKIDVDLILSVEKYRHKVDINIRARKSALNTVEETQDMLSSLSLAFDNIEKRVKKENEKLRERKRRKNKEREAFPLQAEAEEQPRRIIQSKDYSLKPMSLEDAIIQFDLKKKEVFAFRALDSEKWAIIHRRKDGNYGYIELE
jgi:putative sigma-54 modulation protein